MQGPGTFFIDGDGNSLGSAEELLAIPLFKGMTITIHGHENEYRVVEWRYHHGQPDEDGGLRIVLEKVGGESVYETRGILSI